MKGSGGDELGALFLMDRDDQNHQGNLASGNMVGSIGASSVSDSLPGGVLTVRPDGCSSGAPSLSLWLERWRRSRIRTNSKGVHSLTPLIPRVAPGAVATPASCDKGGVRRLSCLSGRVWVPPSRVLPDSEVEEEGNTHRAHHGPNLPRSWCLGEVHRVPSRHERGVPAADGRRIEVQAQDLPLFGGVQLAADITLRSVLTCNGESHPHAKDVDGAMLVAARRDKEATYPEFAVSDR